MTLGNRHGEVSAHDPTSALYGKIGRNTPLRFSVDAGGPHLNFPTSGSPLVSTPDHASLGVAGDLDVRIDVAPNSWADTAALVSRHRFTASQVHFVLLVGQNGVLQLLWSPTGTTGAQRYVTATAPVPCYDGQRVVLRATLDINNGSGGCTARFSYARTLDSALWLPIGDPVTQVGTTSVFDGTAPLDLGDSDLSVTPDGLTGLGRVQGRIHGAQVYDGTTLKVDVRPETQAAPGAARFTDDAGRVWTLTGSAALTNRHIRLEGEVPAWPPERHLSGNDSTVTIAPAGIMRRLGIGKRPLDSAIRRYLTAAGPVECWPLTDGAEATSGAPLIGTAPVQVLSSSRPAWKLRRRARRLGRTGPQRQRPGEGGGARSVQRAHGHRLVGGLELLPARIRPPGQRVGTLELRPHLEPDVRPGPRHRRARLLHPHRRRRQPRDRQRRRLRRPAPPHPPAHLLRRRHRLLGGCTSTASRS